MGARESAEMASTKAGEASRAGTDPAITALAESVEWLGRAIQEKCTEDEQRTTALAVALRNLLRAGGT